MEGLLGEAGVPVTVLRAAIVVGAGGISWEITRQLVKNLPAMVVPKWATTLSQPIGVDDVVAYLAGVVGNEEALGRVFEIGGPERLSYLEMLQQAAEVMHGHRLPIVTVPVLTPQLSSQWIGLVTDVDATTGRNLIDSMSTEVVVHDESIREVVPIEPVAYAEAVRRAVEESGERPAVTEYRGQREQHRQRPGDVGEDRREDAARGAALQPDDRAEQHAPRTPASGCRSRRSRRRTRAWSRATG